MSAVNYDDVLEQLRAFGLIDDHLVIGRMRRCKVNGSREKKGWYSLHEITKDDGDTIIVGSYGIWQGADNNAQKIDIKKQALSQEQKAAIKARMDADRKQAEANRNKEINRAAAQAERTWKACQPIGESDYLTKKGIQPHGVRFTETGSIVIPLCDNGGRVYGLQFILPDSHPRKKKTGRNKEFWPAGMAMKGHYFIIGGSPSNILLVAEGYATAASLHEATGYPVAVAFNANNLLPVSQNLQKRYKRTKILVCGDDDYLTSGNPGASSAESAALAVQGEWCVPQFTIDRNGEKITDFNDLHLAEGLHVVQKQIEDTLHSIGWVSDAKPQGGAQAGGRGDALKPLLDVEEAVERFSLIYGAGGTLFDHQESALIPKSDVLDICVDHCWREWKLHQARKVVRLSEVGFDPTEKDHNITCNLWSGWPTTPKAGNCENLLWLLKHLCSGEEVANKDEIYQWVLKWLAYPIQHRGAKMRTALIFHGPQGAGKNLFFEAYLSIFGKYGRIIGQAEIDDKFNDWASGKLCMIADEVVARQELYHIKNKLKALITGETIRINPKNVAAHDERNHVNIVFLSNETQPLVLEKDDRRFCVVWVPPKMTDNIYADIAEEIANGGIEALHDYLLNLPLGDFTEHSKPPLTRSKQDLIEINLDSIQRFMQDHQQGDTALPYCPCHSEDLYTAYQRWCNKTGVSRPRELSQFVGNIAKMPGWQKERKRVYKNMSYTGEKIQITMLIPTDQMMSIEKPTDHWMTDCYLDFKDKLNPNGGIYE